MLIVVQIVMPSRLWLSLLVGLLIVIGMALGWAVVAVRGVRLERRLQHTWVQVGDLLEEVFVLHNDSAFSVVALEVHDRSSVPGYATTQIRAAESHQAASWRQEGRSTRRGVFCLGPTQLRLTDPLGLFEVRIDDLHKREVLVMPPVLHNLGISLRAGGSEGVTASRQRSLYETASISGVRDYHAGDPIRRIHWPLSVRHNRFLVKEFDRDRAGDTWLALDLDAQVHVGEGDYSTVEDGVVWSASWAWHLIRQGRAVGLTAYGPDRVFVRTAAGRAHLWTILRALAPVKTQTRVPLAGLLEEITPHLLRGDSLVVITPSLDAAWVEMLARPALQAVAKSVVLITSESRDAETATDQIASPEWAVQAASLTAIRSMLAGMDIPLQIASSRQRLEAAPAAKGSGDWEFFTTGLGRVIVKARPTVVRR